MPPERPWWVRLALWGVPNRPTAWLLVWVTAAAAIAFVVLGFSDLIYVWGGVFIFGAFHYYAAIRWMDRHGGW